VTGDGIINLNHLISIFKQQFFPYYMEQNFGMRATINSYLINHQKITTLFFWGAIILEISTVIGFFTKKHDKLIVVFLIIFHLFNWLLMDISPIGQCSLLSILCLVPFAKKIIKLS
jgi:hypothetical protein